VLSLSLWQVRELEGKLLVAETTRRKLHNQVYTPQPSTLNPQPSTLNPQPSTTRRKLHSQVLSSES